MTSTATPVPVQHISSRATCRGCGARMRRDDMVGDICPTCFSERGHEAKQKKQLSRKDAKERFWDRLTLAVTKSEDLQDSSLIGQAVKRVLQDKRIGGIAGFAEKFSQFFDETFTDASPGSKSRKIRVGQMFLKLLEQHDEMMRATAPDLSGLDPEDLKATLAGLALELIEQDEYVQDAILPEFLARRPDVLERLGYVRMAGEVIDA